MISDDSSKIYDVIIIGSGPAGSSAAYFLAEKKSNVLIIDKASLPRYKTCGGGVVNRVKNLLPINFDNVTEINCNTSEIFDHNNNLQFVTKRTKPIIMMTMRESFDYHILKEAIKLGASLKDKTEVVNIEESYDFVEVITNKAVYRTKFVVISSGATGINTNKIGIQTSNFKLPALEYEIYLEEKEYQRFKNAARFDFDIVSHGYGWVFPKKDHLSIGIITFKKKQKDLNYKMNEYLKLLNIENIIKSERHGYFIPINYKGKKFSKGRIFLTGDAAGFSDPVTGEGISHAIESGKIAAEVLLDTGYNKYLASDIYNNRINHAIIQEFKYAKIISALVYEYPLVRKLIFKLYGQKLSELMTDIFTGENTYTQLLTDPMNYMKLLKYFFPTKIKNGIKLKHIPKNSGISKSAI